VNFDEMEPGGPGGPQPRAAPKDPRQRRPDPAGPGGRSFELGDRQPVLYRLPELLEAAEGEIIFICKGEREANKLAALGLVATSLPQGAGKWDEQFADPLRHSRVVVLLDDDELGQRQAQAIAGSCRKRGIQAAVMPLEGDVSGWPDAEGTRDRLVALAEDALEAPPADEGAPYEPLAEPELTEDGIARLFTERYRDELRFDHDVGSWFLWTGDRWERERTGLAFALARDLARKAGEGAAPRARAGARRSSFIGGVEQLARTDRAHAVTQDQWDRDPWLLGCPGATIDLRTGKARQPDRADGITKLTGTAPADTADCPRWLAFLDEATGGDPDLIRYLQQIAGYAATGDTREHAMFFFYGPGGNGKAGLPQYPLRRPRRLRCHGRDGDLHRVRIRPPYNRRGLPARRPARHRQRNRAGPRLGRE
jgi:putative DNA primase/helicase